MVQACALGVVAGHWSLCLILWFQVERQKDRRLAAAYGLAGMANMIAACLWTAIILANLVSGG